MHLKMFEKCALAAMQIQTFLGDVQAGKEKKTGMVMNVVDGKPQFVHRTFEEHSTAG
jgi:hypothetical protein